MKHRSPPTFRTIRPGGILLLSSLLFAGCFEAPHVPTEPRAAAFPTPPPTAIANWTLGGTIHDNRGVLAAAAQLYPTKQKASLDFQLYIGATDMGPHQVALLTAYIENATGARRDLFAAPVHTQPRERFGVVGVPMVPGPVDSPIQLASGWAWRLEGGDWISNASIERLVVVLAYNWSEPVQSWPAWWVSFTTPVPLMVPGPLLAQPGRSIGILQYTTDDMEGPDSGVAAGPYWTSKGNLSCTFQTRQDTLLFLDALVGKWGKVDPSSGRASKLTVATDLPSFKSTFGIDGQRTYEFGGNTGKMGVGLLHGSRYGERFNVHFENDDALTPELSVIFADIPNGLNFTMALA